MYSTRPPGVGTGDRAASAIVGLVLLFGLVIAGAGIIFWAGMDAKQSVQSASEVDTAETSLQEVSTKLSTLAFKGDGAVTSFDLSGKDANDVSIVDDGEIHFELNGKSACSATVELGSIIYENDNGQTVAYQAGAVFKKTDGGVSIVQSPSMEYRTKVIDGTNVRTLRFPITNVSGDVHSSGTVTATANTSKSGRFQKDLCLTGSNTDEIEYVREIKITVDGSSYYKAWERYFREEFGAAGTISVDDANQKVSVVAPLGSGVTPDQFEIDDEEIYGAIFSGSSAGELLLQTQHAAVNSYDSADGPWGGSDPTYGSEGTIITRGNVEVQANGAMVDGNVYAEGEVDLSNSCAGGAANCVSGDVYVNNSTAGAGGPTTALYPTSKSQREDAIGGSWGNGTIVPDVPTMDATIDDTLSTVDEYNNNDDVSVVNSEQIQFSSGSATVESGVYYLDEFTVPDGNTLTLDTSSGDIVFAVDGDVDIGDDARVEVTGPGQVRTFIGESTTSGNQVTVGGKSTVTVTDSGTPTFRSNAFFLACKAGCNAKFEKGNGGTDTRFTGVIYGPGDAADDGTVELGKFTEVWGALVSGTVTFEQQSEFHFDTTLKNSELDEDGDGVPDVIDDDNDFPDGDGDGFSESEDDCPNVAGTGENGCAGVTEDEDANTLIVNQSSATITVVGSQIANERVTTKPVETRHPLNVELVIDDSGSMYYGNADPNNPYRTQSFGDWSDWETINKADYAGTGYYEDSPEPGYEWEVKYERCENWKETGNGWKCTKYEDETTTEIITAFESLPAAVDKQDEVRRHQRTSWTVTVPEDEVYIGYTQYGGGATERFFPGDTFSNAEYEYYYAFDIGSDPYYERLEAGKSFVGQMQSKDRVGVLQFEADVTRKHGLSNAWTTINASMKKPNWGASGSTNITGALIRATNNLNDSADTRDDLAVNHTIVLLTDGTQTVSPGDADNDGDYEPAWKEIQGLAKQAHSANITIYTVALGEGSNTNKTLLKQIANTGDPVTDGEFYHVEDAGDLEEKFGEIATRAKTEKTRMIQHANTTTTIHLGGDQVSFDGNTNPESGFPSKTVDSNLEPGDAVHFATTMYNCNGNTTYDTITNTTNGQTYNETYCTNNAGTAEESTHASDSKHQIFTDGDAIPSVQTDAWYKDDANNTVKEMVENYNASLVDGDEFTLPENDAIILVNISDDEPNDHDFMVIHFDANDQAPPDPEDQDVDAPDDDDDDDSDTDGDGTSNDYVISLPSSDVNVSAGNPSLAPAAASITGPQDVLDSTTSTLPNAPSAPAASVRD
ncbi:vWA domain-containing protein [Halorubellus litoreus]|uniref:VWA domain-containing protein n=1 Tax=Halorubellus litoreus TaxID=755308 RepID=A0ABD5VPA1_9EURY